MVKFNMYLFIPNILCEGDLCPALFPRLIRESTLIQRRFEVDLSHADCMRIISPFMHRFYPMSALRAIRSIQSLPVLVMVEIVQKPGYFAALWRNTEEQCIFDPPRWIDLSLPVASGVTLKSLPIATDESQLTLDGFSPMTYLGLSQEEVLALSPDSLRTRSLQHLPQSLNAFLPPEETAQVIISIATSSTEGLPHLLSAEGFRACLNKLRVSAHPTPPTWTMRIRIHVNKTVQSWATYESLAFAWAQAANTLLQALGASFYLIRNPRDQEEIPILCTTDLTDASLQGYCFPRTTGTTIGTFDIWCCTSHASWGESPESFVYSGPETTAYFTFLTSNNINAEFREKHPYGVYPCVALTGSDRRDDDSYLFQEYSARLSSLEEVVPPFSIVWMSLLTSPPCTLMVKCVATTPEHFIAVRELFRRLCSATVHMELLHTRYLESYFLDSRPSEAALSEIFNAQQRFEDESVRVVLKGIPGLNPFTTILPTDPHTPLEDRSLSIAQYVHQGGVMDVDGEELENPIIKMTTDKKFSRYYLYAHQHDAATLIRCGRALRSSLLHRLGIDGDSLVVHEKDAADVFLPTPAPQVGQRTGDDLSGWWVIFRHNSVYSCNDVRPSSRTSLY